MVHVYCVRVRTMVPWYTRVHVYHGSTRKRTRVPVVHVYHLVYVYGNIAIRTMARVQTTTIA